MITPNGACEDTSYRGSRAEKLEALTDLATSKTTLDTAEASTAWHAPFIPVAGGADWASYPQVTDLLPFQQPGVKFNRTWSVAPAASTVQARRDRLVATADLDERARMFVTPATGRNIYTRTGHLPPISTLLAGAPSEPIVRFAFRSFDRQWALSDIRSTALERPALRASMSDKQIFLTSLLTTRVGGGPCATVAAYLPDLHHFRGSYGGKDVVPLYRDAKGTPNADPVALKFLSEKLGAKISVEQLLAYAFGVLAGTDYTERFHQELETPGPRVPLTADPALFEQMERHGENLIWLQTFGESSGTARYRVLAFSGIPSPRVWLRPRLRSCTTLRPKRCTSPTAS